MAEWVKFMDMCNKTSQTGDIWSLPEVLPGVATPFDPKPSYVDRPTLPLPNSETFKVCSCRCRSPVSSLPRRKC